MQGFETSIAERIGVLPFAGSDITGIYVEICGQSVAMKSDRKEPGKTGIIHCSLRSIYVQADVLRKLLVLWPEALQSATKETAHYTNQT